MHSTYKISIAYIKKKINKHIYMKKIDIANSNTKK